MSEHITNQNTEATEATETAAAPQYTVEYILSQIAEIQTNTTHLDECMTQLAFLESGGPEDIGAQAKANALADIVRCRETTNQQMLSLYEKMLDRLAVKDEPFRQITKMSALIEWAKTLKAEDYDDQVWDYITSALYEKLQYA